MLLYIGLNAAISARAVALTRPLVERVAQPRMIVAGEVPLTFWKRKMIWRGDAIGGAGDYDLAPGPEPCQARSRDHAAAPRRPAPRRGREARQARPRLPVLVAHADGPSSKAAMPI